MNPTPPAPAILGEEWNAPTSSCFNGHVFQLWDFLFYHRCVLKAFASWMNFRQTSEWESLGEQRSFFLLVTSSCLKGHKGPPPRVFSVLKGHKGPPPCVFSVSPAQSWPTCANPISQLTGDSQLDFTFLITSSPKADAGDFRPRWVSRTEKWLACCYRIDIFTSLCQGPLLLLVKVTDTFLQEYFKCYNEIHRIVRKTNYIKIPLWRY